MACPQKTVATGGRRGSLQRAIYGVQVKVGGTLLSSQLLP